MRHRAKRGTPVEERFWSWIDVKGPDDCWEWQGNKDRKGYGKFKVYGKNYTASRFVYELVNGPIPDGLFVCHKCDNPPCCNPAHLWLGTSLDNVRDMMAKGRDNHPTGVERNYDESGEKNPRAKLTWEQVREIRRNYVYRKIGRTTLARQYGVSERAIKFIVDGVTWVEKAGSR